MYDNNWLFMLNTFGKNTVQDKYWLGINFQMIYLFLDKIDNI